MFRCFCHVLLALWSIALVDCFHVTLDNPPPAANSTFIARWDRDGDSGLTYATVDLILTYPNATSTNVSVPLQGQSQGTVSMFASDPGAYTINALGEPNNYTLPGMLPLAFTVGPADSSAGGTNSPTSAFSPQSTNSNTSDQTATPSDTSSSTSNANSESSSSASATAADPSATNTTQTTLPSSGDISSPTSTTSSSSDTSSSNSPTSPASSASSQISRSSNHLGVILGATLGGIAFLLFVALLLFLFLRHKKRSRPVSFHREMMVRSPGPSLFPASRAASPFTSYSAVAVDDTSAEHPSSFTDLLARANSIAATRNGHRFSSSDPEVTNMQRSSQDVMGSANSDEAVPHSSSFSDTSPSGDMSVYHRPDVPHERADSS